jgi:hypothetical protein
VAGPEVDLAPAGPSLDAGSRASPGLPVTTESISAYLSASEIDLPSLAAAEEQLLIRLYQQVGVSLVNTSVMARRGGGTSSGSVLIHQATL